MNQNFWNDFPETFRSILNRNFRKFWSNGSHPISTILEKLGILIGQFVQIWLEKIIMKPHPTLNNYMPTADHFIMILYPLWLTWTGTRSTAFTLGWIYNYFHCMYWYLADMFDHCSYTHTANVKFKCITFFQASILQLLKLCVYQQWLIMSSYLSLQFKYYDLSYIHLYMLQLIFGFS